MNAYEHSQRNHRARVGATPELGPGKVDNELRDAIESASRVSTTARCESRKSKATCGS
jgi:hypothetical protein